MWVVLSGWEVQKRNGDNFYAVRDLAFSMPYLLAGVTEGRSAPCRLVITICMNKLTKP